MCRSPSIEFGIGQAYRISHERCAPSHRWATPVASVTRRHGANRDVSFHGADGGATRHRRKLRCALSMEHRQARSILAGGVGLYRYSSKPALGQRAGKRRCHARRPLVRRQSPQLRRKPAAPPGLPARDHISRRKRRFSNLDLPATLRRGGAHQRMVKISGGAGRRPGGRVYVERPGDGDRHARHRRHRRHLVILFAGFRRQGRARTVCSDPPPGAVCH